MNSREEPRRIIVGITGASGAEYARRLVECLCQAEHETHVIASPNGRRLFQEELGLSTVSADSLLGSDSDRVVVHNYRDVGAKIASGSFRTAGMIVCPCSAAAVTLKEGRRLILVPREMPLSRIDLLNALRLQETGAIICPASPGFYMEPKTIGDLIDFVVGKLLDLLNVPHELNTRWADRVDAVGRKTSDSSNA